MGRCDCPKRGGGVAVREEVGLPVRETVGQERGLSSGSGHWTQGPFSSDWRGYRLLRVSMGSLVVREDWGCR